MDEGSPPQQAPRLKQAKLADSSQPVSTTEQVSVAHSEPNHPSYVVDPNHVTVDHEGRPQVVLKVRHLSACYDHISVSFQRNGDFHLTCQDRCKVCEDDDDQHIIVHRPEQGICEGVEVKEDDNTSVFTVFGNISRKLPLNMLLVPPAAAAAAAASDSRRF